MSTVDHGALDLRRKAQIAFGKAQDHAPEVVVAALPDFDLDKTIFTTVEGAVPRMVMRDKLAVQLFWSDAAVQRISTAFLTVPVAPRHDKALMDFMANDCNFAMEHADGSFMDHLKFCYEYSAVHFKDHSPRVLLLHSILGVATNYFPMKQELLPKLQGMLTDFENTHVEAFPSILRLLNYERMPLELENAADLSKLVGIQYHRVLDNAVIELDAESLWVQLNYQLIHLLDFLPSANWADNMDDQLFVVFISLYGILQKAGKLTANVDFELTQIERSQSTKPITLGGFISSMLPKAVKSSLRNKAIEKFSAKIGHSLDFTLVWEGDERAATFGSASKSGGAVLAPTPANL